MHGQANLLEIVGALGATGGLTSSLDGGGRRAMRTAMIAMTTKSSIRVNPRRARRGRTNMEIRPLVGRFEFIASELARRVP
jgi:hypothetical protein